MDRETDMPGQITKLSRNFILIGIFAVAMGLLEAIVVVYLRQIYYPRGFDFPLTLLSPRMVAVESSREAATIVMLVSVAIIAGRDSLRRFAYFIHIFAVWDICYYLCLKVLLDWPPSLFTWDILFLIPVPWAGPVLAPLICSLTMLIMAGTIIRLQETGCMVRIGPPEWGLALLGAAVILFTFVRDYSGIILSGDLHPLLRDPAKNGELIEAVARYRPTHYQWGLFILGEILILCSLMLAWRSAATRRPQ